LLKVKLYSEPIPQPKMDSLKKELAQLWDLSVDEADYFVFTDSIANSAYNLQQDRINILFKNGELKDITEAADTLSLSVLSKPVEKHFLCLPTQLTKHF
nr:phosphohydrolase [Flavobacteriales bacterium]